MKKEIKKKYLKLIPANEYLEYVNFHTFLSQFTFQEIIAIKNICESKMNKFLRAKPLSKKMPFVFSLVIFLVTFVFQILYYEPNSSINISIIICISLFFLVGILEVIWCNNINHNIYQYELLISICKEIQNEHLASSSK